MAEERQKGFVVEAIPHFVFPNAEKVARLFLRENGIKKGQILNYNLRIARGQISVTEPYVRVGWGRGWVEVEKGNCCEEIARYPSSVTKIGCVEYVARGEINGEEVNLRAIRGYRNIYREERVISPPSLLSSRLICIDSKTWTIREDKSDLWFLCWQKESGLEKDFFNLSNFKMPFSLQEILSAS